MNVDDIGKKSGVEELELYCSTGLIMDLHLSGKLTNEDAVSWARELHADYILELLLNQYAPFDLTQFEDRVG